MAREKEVDIAITVGSIAIIVLVVIIIVFFVIHQRRILMITLQTQRKLMKAEIDTKEREQRRIATELHDTLGAELTAIAQIAERIDADVPEKRLLWEKIEEASTSLRKISNDLIPQVLEKHGFRVSIESIREQWEREGFEVNVNTDNYEDHPPEERIDLSLYRIVQELMSNIYKHSEASRVDLNMSSSGNKVKIVISDDGNGFIPELRRTSYGKKLGMRKINGRIQYLDAEITRENQKPKGTIVTITKAL